MPTVQNSCQFVEKKSRAQAGMTMIELGIVMGIVAVLLALVLGLARHVDAVVKIRRTQSELSVWHQALDRWYKEFGEYPYARVDTVGDTILALPEPDWSLTDIYRYPLTTLTNHCIIITNDGYTHSFANYLESEAKLVDPWGTPYIYLAGERGHTYQLLSCGPDRTSHLIPSGIHSSPTPSFDDIYFER